MKLLPEAIVHRTLVSFFLFCFGRGGGKGGGSDWGKI